MATKKPAFPIDAVKPGKSAKKPAKPMMPKAGGKPMMPMMPGMKKGGKVKGC